MLLAAGTGLLASGPTLAHLEWLPPLRGFALFGLGLLLCLLAFAATLLVGALRRGRFDWPALFIGTPVAALIAFALVQSRGYPRINDITTDFADPPRFVHAGTLAANRGRDLSYPGEAFAQEQSRAYPQVRPLLTNAQPTVAFEKALARAMPTWEVTRVDRDRLAFEGVATTRVFRFRDDFVVEIRTTPQGQTAIHMRSKSRDGRGDLGANAARIQRFLSLLAEELTQP